jgi:hypothetical protein
VTDDTRRPTSPPRPGWPHVDFEHVWLRLEPGETKNGEGRMYPLTPRLRAVLEIRPSAAWTSSRER